MWDNELVTVSNLYSILCVPVEINAQISSMCLCAWDQNLDPILIATITITEILLTIKEHFQLNKSENASVSVYRSGCILVRMMSQYFNN